jgi:phosphoribosylamine--glycine ligase
MRVLVVGGGGREHALVHSFAQSTLADRIFCAPGNAGTAQIADNIGVGAEDLPALLDFASREQVDLTVVGPEAPLVAGICDLFEEHGLAVFGPNRDAAQLEGSKVFAKEVMREGGVAAGAYSRHETPESALAALSPDRSYPLVVKADGLAAGKGVVVAMSKTEAFDAIDMMLSDNKLGDAGARVVIEEFLTGEEASFIVMVDGQNVLALATSQDHKRLLDGDHGPNTGGMGAYSPAPVVTPGIHAHVLREVIQPVVRGMEQEGITYTGFLYAGLMIDPQGGIKVLEFNCRMGDPETQPIMLRLKSDFAAIVEHAINGTLDQVEVEWDRRTALGVVMAAANYPDTPRKGDVITGLPINHEDAHVFHAGTAMQDGQVVTNGGRVLCVTALGTMVKMAQKRAYEIADGIHFDGCQMRRDIGWRAISAHRK